MTTTTTHRTSTSRSLPFALLFALALGLAAIAAGCDGGTSASPDAGGIDAKSATPADAGPAHCHDGTKDVDETDVDCGGSCGKTCVANASCGFDDDCAGDSVCESLDGCSGFDCAQTCRTVIASCAGNPCGDPALCHSQVHNDRPVSYCALPSQPGQPCQETTFDKDVNGCTAGFACADTNGNPFMATCQAKNIAPGQPCGGDLCTDGFACFSRIGGNPNTCQAVGHAGAFCLNDIECGKGLACDPVANKCAPRGGVGASCFAGQSPCATGLTCQFAAGIACQTFGDCGSNTACCATATGAECRQNTPFNACTPPAGTCEPPPPPGP